MNTKLKNILLCYASGMGIKSISSAFDISQNTVRRYVRMYQDSGIPAEKLPSLSDARLQELFAIPGRENADRQSGRSGLKHCCRNMQHGFRAGA
ncbi:hypothetical protein IMSAGC006_00928 [Muribaculaceae bacterium]|nr:hypothetical protein IMSAGC006_00928 [Muribaculaceae bacterium]